MSYFQSPKLSLLLQWCQAVCALFDVPVQNFSASFSDGPPTCPALTARLCVCCKNTDSGRQPFCMLLLLLLFHIGRALCYLIHYYHPTQLPLSAIRTVTTKAPAPAPVEDDVPDENVVKGRVVRAVALAFSPGAANGEAALLRPLPAAC